MRCDKGKSTPHIQVVFYREHVQPGRRVLHRSPPPFPQHKLHCRLKFDGLTVASIFAVLTSLIIGGDCMGILMISYSSDVFLLDSYKPRTDFTESHWNYITNINCKSIDFPSASVIIWVEEL